VPCRSAARSGSIGASRRPEMTVAEPNARAPKGAATNGEGHPSGDERFELIDKALKRARFSQDQLIELLHTAQDVFGYLSPDLLVYIARALKLPPSRVYGVATFYHLFTFEEPGDHSCTICTGTACFVKGADDIVMALSREYSVAAGQTTKDGRFTLSTARCLGSCGLAPVVVLDGEVRGHLDPEGALTAVAANLAAENEQETDDTAAPRVAEPAGVAGEGS
jgi:bidirectional [NiFe] hydrogenase diaphorase subunit